jgi:flagellar hook-basal body complex protein FliE
MPVTPVNGLNTTGYTTLATAQSGRITTGAAFESILKDMVNQVQETENVVRQDQFRVATGQADDLHTVTMNLAKADLALQTLVQVRNKALDAYNEIMKITL